MTHLLCVNVSCKLLSYIHSRCIHSILSSKFRRKKGRMKEKALKMQITILWLHSISMTWQDFRTNFLCEYFFDDQNVNKQTKVKYYKSAHKYKHTHIYASYDELTFPINLVILIVRWMNTWIWHSKHCYCSLHTFVISCDDLRCQYAGCVSLAVRK